LSQFPVLAAMPKRFCNDHETSELFRLGSIILYLRLHGRDSGCSVNAQAQPVFPAQLGREQIRRCRRRGARARWPSPPAIGSPAGASTARLCVTQDDLRHLQIVAVTSLPETFRNAVTVLRAWRCSQSLSFITSGRP